LGKITGKVQQFFYSDLQWFDCRCIHFELFTHVLQWSPSMRNFEWNLELSRKCGIFSLITGLSILLRSNNYLHYKKSNIGIYLPVGLSVSMVYSSNSKQRQQLQLQAFMKSEAISFQPT
jgi:hypothetical protein